MGTTVFAGYCTNLGKIRRNNEDNLFFNGVFLDKGTAFAGDKGRFAQNTQLYAICDGMGGGPRGEEASHLAVSRLGVLLERFRSGEDLHEGVDRYISGVNGAIVSLCPGGHAGTTIVMLALSGGMATTAHLGDSRAYLYRNNRLACLTQDHTEEQRLKNIGMAEKTAVLHKNTLTRYLGMDVRDLVVRPTYSHAIQIQQGDMFLLCSDGLTGMLGDEEIESLLYEQNGDPASLLVDAALKNGGADNVTVMAALVE